MIQLLEENTEVTMDLAMLQPFVVRVTRTASLERNRSARFHHHNAYRWDLMEIGNVAVYCSITELISQDQTYQALSTPQIGLSIADAHGMFVWSGNPAGFVYPNTLLCTMNDVHGSLILCHRDAIVEWYTRLSKRIGGTLLTPYITDPKTAVLDSVNSEHTRREEERIAAFATAIAQIEHRSVSIADHVVIKKRPELYGLTIPEYLGSQFSLPVFPVTQLEGTIDIADTIATYGPFALCTFTIRSLTLRHIQAHLHPYTLIIWNTRLVVGFSSLYETKIDLRFHLLMSLLALASRDTMLQLRKESNDHERQMMNVWFEDIYRDWQEMIVE